MHNLTDSIACRLTNDTATNTTTTFDPSAEDEITESYGLLTNTIEELMFDLYDQEAVLKGYLLQQAVYRNLIHLDNTFAVSKDIYPAQIFDCKENFFM